jgi:adenylate cyclase
MGAPSLRPIATANRLSRVSALRMMLVGVAVACVVGLLGFFKGNPIEKLDHVMLDQIERSSSSGRHDDLTVVIDIDEVSLSAVGQWPWPRYRVAALIEKVAAQRPASIGLDVLFSEPDRSSLVNIQQTFKRDFGVDVAFTGVPAGLLDNDGYLGYTIGRTGVVASNYFYFDHVNKTKVDPRPGITFSGDTGLLSLQDATGILVNADEIAAQTRTTGFMNIQRDDDGFMRRIPLLIRRNDIVYPNLSLATVMRSLGLDHGTIESDAHGPLIRIGTHRIAIDENGFATLRFNGRPNLYSAISAVDVLNGRFDTRDLAGKIVFIGSSAVGLNDVHETAVDPRFPGLKIQAVAAENILNDRFVRTPTWAPIVSLVACLLVGVAVSAIFVFASEIYWTLLGTLVAGAVMMMFSMLPYANAGLFISPAASLVTAALLFVMFSVARFAIEKRRAFRWLKQLQNTRQVTIESMASVAETRDPETGAHIKRTQHYVKAIAEELRRSGEHLGTLSDEYIELLFISAPLHDIGKVGVPDHILLKPGRLTAEEFEIMKQHAEFGRKIIFSSAKNIDGDNFLILAGEIAATHHEKWDGTGYPLGLAGQDIPLSGRIMATADIYDALISRRCYKEPFSHELATSLMREARGTIFDPAVLAAFFRIETIIKAIAAEYGDEHDAEPAPVDVPSEFVGSLASA